MAFYWKLQPSTLVKAVQITAAITPYTYCHTSPPQADPHTCSYFSLMFKSSSTTACTACRLHTLTEHVGGGCSSSLLSTGASGHVVLCYVGVPRLCWLYPFYSRGHTRAGAILYVSSFPCWLYRRQRAGLEGFCPSTQRDPTRSTASDSG